jgi:leucyl-tRNA synthetase
MVDRYVPQEIEPRWAAKWERDGLYRSEVDPNRPKFYALTMLPYPSGDLHIGHWYAMSPSDARARWMRMRGYNVLFPMGFDGFGLPAENAAIQRKVHPKQWTYANIERMRKQMRSMGTIFDWQREAVSADPKYYKWTQYFFLKFFENGLAYRQRASVDFCPKCNTTLAREQVWGEDRHCERCGTPVIKKDLEQWFFRITRFADELLDYSTIKWPEKVRLMQTNWIGKSEGAQVNFFTEHEDALTVFTTRPDTLWGATFMVLAPEHPLVQKVTSAAQRATVEAYVAESTRRTEIERTAADKDKTGVFTGGYAINPVNGERIPIWVADYVLMSYGFGAIMAVPAHDERDFAFARKFGLPVRVVIQGEGEELDGDTIAEAYPGEGRMVNSAEFDGTPTANGAAVKKVTAWLESKGLGKGAINYRLRDWLISRQRYWGAPIPIVYCEKDGIVPVPYDQLPVLLPDDVEFMPTGESPLKFHAGFLNTTCPKCGGPARRETDTMDTFMCSSWYHLRYLSPDYDEGPFDPVEAAYWLPVDQYTGGIEHATMHLMYTRFFTKAMRECGIWEKTEKLRPAGAPRVDNEPMLALFNQGMILGEPSSGYTVVVTGQRDGEKVVAAKIAVVNEEAVAAMLETEKVVNSLADQFESALKGVMGNDYAPTDETHVIGEIVKRTENLLGIETKSGDQVAVEVTDDTEIYDHAGNRLTIDDLRYRLGVEKMSKSKGNVVAPDELVAKYGADTVRGYLMFAFRWESGGPWDSQGIQGVVRWLNDVWSLVTGAKPQVPGQPSEVEVKALRRKAHQTIKKVSESLEEFSFNTCVAAMMELKNTLLAARKTPVVNHPVWDEAISTMLTLMAPVTPHIAEELWARIGREYSIHNQPWPAFDPDAAKADEITLVVQVNGKVRDRIIVPADISEDEAKARALASDGAQKHLNRKAPKQVVYVASRGMINIVV